jgi:hypothetical protein
MFPYKKIKKKIFFFKKFKNTHFETYPFRFLIPKVNRKPYINKNKGNMLAFPLKTTFIKKNYLKSFEVFLTLRNLPFHFPREY